MTDTPAQLIDAKGAQHIADAIGVKLGTVRVWKNRNSIPRTVWPELIAAFDDLSLGKLRALESRSGRPKADAA